MKVLLVNYYYKPMVDAHAYRWAQLSEYWTGKGFEVDVICSKVTDVKSVENCCGVNIVRVGFRVANKIQSEVVSSQVNKKFNSNIFDSIKRRLKVGYRKIYWPDGLWHWGFAAAYELLKKEGKQYDLVVSYAPSFSAHLVALMYKKISKRKFYWVADYGDPFSTSASMPHNNETLYGWINYLAEASVLKNADKVCFTSKSTLSDYVFKFGKRNNLEFVPHLVDVDKMYLQGKVVKCEESSVIKLVFIGNFHAGIREPFLASRVIKELAAKLYKTRGYTVLFDIYGASNGVDITSVCDSTIRWHGPLDRECVHEVMQGAHFLVNIENSNCSMIPSKVVEYVATGKPLINIANTDKDVSELMGRYAEIGKAFILKDVSCIISDELLSFIDDNKDSVGISLEVVNNFLVEYRIEKISDRYLSDIA